METDGGVRLTRGGPWPTPADEDVEVRGSPADAIVARISEEALAKNDPKDLTAVGILTNELTQGLGYPDEVARKAAAAIVAVLGLDAIRLMHTRIYTAVLPRVAR